MVICILQMLINSVEKAKIFIISLPQVSMKKCVSVFIYSEQREVDMCYFTHLEDLVTSQTLGHVLLCDQRFLSLMWRLPANRNIKDNISKQ